MDGRSIDASTGEKVAPEMVLEPRPTVPGPRLSYDRGIPVAVDGRPAAPIPAEVAVPRIRAFRALRYQPGVAPDLSVVLSPPYDVISPEQQQRLLARHPRNVVRLDLPETSADEAPDERYRNAARTLAAWRSDGTLFKDAKAAVYACEQTYRVPGIGETRTQRGFFGRLGLEPLLAGSGVRPHERTMAGPREDRYRLLRATGVNTSPVVGLYEDPSGEAGRLLDIVAARPPDLETVDDDGVLTRLWTVPEDGDPGSPATRLCEIAGRGAITIADGHHRYETALRYRDERRMSRSCEEDPPFDYLLALLLETTAQQLTVLPTHRVVRGLGADVDRLGDEAESLFDVRTAERAELAGWGTRDNGGSGRFGLWMRSGGYSLTARREAFEPFLPEAGAAARALDVTLLGVALERLCAIDPDAVAGGRRIGYTKSAEEAIALVDAGTDGADAAFLLEPTPVESIIRVAADGDVLPQKSTYFHPKPLTGLVINPHEW